MQKINFKTTVQTLYWSEEWWVMGDELNGYYIFS
jgi:hypothetical protein